MVLRVRLTDDDQQVAPGQRTRWPYADDAGRPVRAARIQCHHRITGAGSGLLTDIAGPTTGTDRAAIAATTTSAVHGGTFPGGTVEAVLGGIAVETFATSGGRRPGTPVQLQRATLVPRRHRTGGQVGQFATERHS